VTVKKLRTKVVSVGWKKYEVGEGETSPLTIPEPKISSLQKTLHLTHNVKTARSAPRLERNMECGSLSSSEFRILQFCIVRTALSPQRGGLLYSE